MPRSPRSTAHATIAAASLLFAVVACSDEALTKPPISDISLTPSNATVPVGGTLALKAQVTNEAGVPVDTMRVFWSTSDSAVAVVDEAGVVSARKSGQVRIAATALGMSATAALVVSGASTPPTTPPVTPPVTPPTIPPVTPPAVATVVVSFSSAAFKEGQTRQATVTLRSATGAILTGRLVSWSTSNDRVATVSSTGVVRAIRKGDATITARSEGKQGTTVVIVRKDDDD